MRFWIAALVLWLAVAPHAAWAQSSMLRGTLVDSTAHAPVAGAEIRLTSASDSTVVRLTTSGEDGAFGVTGLPAGTWRLQAMRLGYAILRRTLTVTGATQDLGRIAMQPTALSLPQVEVNGTPPTAVQRADTTEFEARSVRTHPDATAEELVTKLPGVTVDNSGTVKSNGETVQQVLVDGKPFFGNDATLALRNLPAEVIEKIQVFDKLSDQAEFTGFDDGQSIKTMNVILRADHPITFGKAFAGGGDDRRYQAGGDAFVLNGDTRLAAIGLSNNVNQQNFSSQDVLGLLDSGGGHGGLFGSTLRRLSGRSNRGDAQTFLVGGQDGITTTQSLGTHVDALLGGRLDVSQSYFFNEGDNHNLQDLDRRYTAPPDSVTGYTQHLGTSGRTWNHRFDGRYTWAADSSLIDVPRVYLQGHHFGTALDARNELATGLPASQVVDQNLVHADGYNLTNHLLLRHRFARATRTLSLDLGLGGTLKNADGALGAVVDRGPGTETASDTLDQQSHLHTTSSSASARLVYTEPAGRNGVIQASFAPSVNDARSVHDAFTPDPFGAATPVEERLLTNDFRSLTSTERGGLGYLFHHRGLRLTLTLDVQRSVLRSQRDAPDAQTGQQTFVDALPAFLLNQNLSGHRNLRLSWFASSRPPNITQLQDVVDNSNPLVLSMGNPNLSQPYVQTFLGRYSVTDPATSHSTFLLLSLQKTDRAIGEATWSASGDTVVMGVPIHRGVRLVVPSNVVRTWDANGFLTFTRPATALRSVLNLNTGTTWSRSRGFLNQVLNTTDTYALSQGVVLASNISPALDFTASYTGTYTIARSDVAGGNTEFFTQAARLALNVIAWKGMVIRQEVHHTLLNGVTNGYEQNVVFWNSSLGEKLFGNRIDLRLIASDVLAQNRNSNRIVTNAYIQDTKNETLPRYLMLNATWTWGQ